MRTWWLIALVVLAGCGPSSYADFRDQLASRWCDRQIRCGEVGASESPQCAVPAALALTAPSRVDIATSIGDHRMQFHRENAQACLDAVKHAPCDPVQAGEDLVRHCHGVVGPNVEVGSSCLGDEECVGGLCVGADCGGTCVAYASPGAACVASGGAPEATCDPTVQYCDGTCQRQRGPGGACSADDECVFDRVCVAGKCSDPPRTGRGKPCGTDLPPCEDGLYCDGYICRPGAQQGEACATPNACADGLVCVSGACAPWLDRGGACSASMPSGCPASQTCRAGTCVAAATAPKAGPLASCTADDGCAAGLYCATGGYCSYRSGIGAACQADHECAAGLGCDGASKTCRAPVSCPAAP